MIGLLIGTGSAALWGLAGSAGLAHGARGPARAIVLGVAALVVALILAGAPRGWAMPRRFDLPAYLATLAAQAVAIAGVAAGLRRRRALVPPAVAIVVACHFVGLWRASGAAPFLALAAALLVAPLAALAIALPATRGAPAPRGGAGLPLAITGLGSCATLLLFVGAALAA